MLTVCVGAGVAVEGRVAARPVEEEARMVVASVEVDDTDDEIEDLIPVVGGAAELELATDEELDTTDKNEEEMVDDGARVEDDWLTVEETDGATVKDWLSVAEEATEEEALTEDPQVPNKALQPVPQ